MLAGMQVEHEVHERAFEAGAEVPIHGEASAGDFGGASQIEDSERFSKLPVRPGNEVEPGRRSPTTNFDVIVGTMAYGNAVIGQVGDTGQDVAELRVVVGGALFGVFD